MTDPRPPHDAADPAPPRRRRRAPASVVARIFQLATAIASVPAAIALSRVAPVALVVSLFVLVAVAVGPRVRAGFDDRKRAAWIGDQAMPLFDIAWIGAALSPFGCLLALPAWPWIGGRGVVVLGSALTLTAATWGALVRRRWIMIQRLEVPIVGWPKQLDGYRIVQLSDIHVGSTLAHDVAKIWAERATALDADLAVVTGDLLSTGTAFHDDVADALASLKARDGVYACLGNHDYYDERALCARLLARGVRVLRNEGVALRDGRLYVAGVEDLWRGRPNVAAALADRPAEAKAILLAHNPRQASLIERDTVAIVLSGHVHAGQFAVPFLARWLSLAHLAERHIVGLYRLPTTTLFAHPGLGTTGPAVRIGSAPAIVELTIRAC
ncbi:MAG: metallophosphoesterase [Polyangiales bacterium]